MLHKTKIIATVGPACSEYNQLLDLVKAGVNVFRLNFSHGTHESHAKVIEYIDLINEKFPQNIAILADLQGPKIRVGEIQDWALNLKEGDTITFTSKPFQGNTESLYLSYPDFHNDVQVGETILMDDGKLEAEIIEIRADKSVVAKMLTPGKLLPHKGVNLPETKISLPSLTEKDLADLDFIIAQNIDWVALSFVRKSQDIMALRHRLTKKGSEAKIIAKIEKPEALNHLRDIILEADAVMIARGDLGVEAPVEKVPMYQTDIIRKCVHRATPVIVATQMMESMITNSRPNRSEVTDVANAVTERTDAVMLSGETAMGKHPALVVKTMVNIIEEVEQERTVYNRNLVPQSHSPSFLSDALCYTSCEIAGDINADAIMGMTQSGYTGFMLSSYRPHAPLYVFTQTKSLINQLSLSWGVQAFYYEPEEDINRNIFGQIKQLKKYNLLQPGDVVVNVGSMPVKDKLPTNLVKITKVI